MSIRASFEQFPACRQGPVALLPAGKILGVAALAWAVIRRLRVVEGMAR